MPCADKICLHKLVSSTDDDKTLRFVFASVRYMSEEQERCKYRTVLNRAFTVDTPKIAYLTRY